MKNIIKGSVLIAGIYAFFIAVVIKTIATLGLFLTRSTNAAPIRLETLANTIAAWSRLEVLCLFLSLSTISIILINDRLRQKYANHLYVSMVVLSAGLVGLLVRS